MKFMTQAFCADPFLSRCECGDDVRMLRRGPVALLPKTHNCESRQAQECVVRTIKAEASVGIHHTPTEIARRLREWGVGDVIRPIWTTQSLRET